MATTSKRKLTAEEKRWRAESDAHTLAEAEAIKSDPARVREAARMAKKMAEEQAEKAVAMRKVANQNPRKKKKKKSTSPKSTVFNRI